MHRNNVIPLHRGAHLAAARPQGGSDSPARPAYLHRVVELPIRTLDDIAREHEGQPDLYASLRDGIRPVRLSRFERICNRLGETYGETPSGFAWFAATLLPICVAAFCAAYFSAELFR